MSLCQVGQLPNHTVPGHSDEVQPVSKIIKTFFTLNSGFGYNTVMSWLPYYYFPIVLL